MGAFERHAIAHMRMLQLQPCIRAVGERQRRVHLPARAPGRAVGTGEIGEFVSIVRQGVPVRRQAWAR